MKRLLLPLLLLSGAAFAQDTVRICDYTGCSDRPRNSSTLEAELAAQALGRFYLVGLEEMGADPGEAERWLMMAADKGDKEA